MGSKLIEFAAWLTVAVVAVLCLHTALICRADELDLEVQITELRSDVIAMQQEVSELKALLDMKEDIVAHEHDLIVYKDLMRAVVVGVREDW